MPLLGFLFALILFLGVAVWLIDRQLVSDSTNWQLRFTSVVVSCASAWVMFGVWYFGYLESGGPWWMQVGEWLLIVFWLSKAFWSAANALVAGRRTDRSSSETR